MTYICSYQTKEKVTVEMKRDIIDKIFPFLNKGEKRSNKRKGDDTSASLESATKSGSDSFDPEIYTEKVAEAVISKIVTEYNLNAKSEEKRSFGKAVVSNALGGIISGILILVLGLPAIYSALDARIDGQDRTIDKIWSSFLFEIEQLRADIRPISNQKYDSMSTKTGISANDFFVNRLACVLDNFDILDQINTITAYDSPEDVIAYDNETGSEISAGELAGQKFLVPYKNGTEDVYFYGQYNTSGHWDGQCIINIYEDGTLKRIVDAEYRNGKLLYSQQVFHYITSHSNEKQDVWAISNREVFYNADGTIAYSAGYTELYKRNGDFDRRFDPESISESDILNIAQFQSAIDLELYACYYGNTANGYFNDSTGQAYMIYYYADKKVKTLYVGNFRDGTMNDSTGNAWWITEDEVTDSGCYGYYKGPFADGDAVYKERYKYNIPQERIDEILAESSKDFSELTWRSVEEYNHN